MVPGGTDYNFIQIALECFFFVPVLSDWLCILKPSPCADCTVEEGVEHFTRQLYMTNKVKSIIYVTNVGQYFQRLSGTPDPLDTSL